MTDYQEAVSRHANRCCPVCAVVCEEDRDRPLLDVGFLMHIGSGPDLRRAVVCRACGAVYVPRPLDEDER